jgi:alpha-L-rhamnosidase
MKKLLPFIVIALFSWSCSENNSTDFRITQLRCNNLENPPGVDRDPVLSWIIASGTRLAGQTAYQIILDKNKANLESDNNCYWNSGKISSPESAWINYSGPALEPGTGYYWKVMLWDNKDKPSGWSESAFFITGLFEKADWSNAKWIGYEEIPDSLLLIPGVHGNGNNLGEAAKKRTVIPYFRKEFTLDKKVSQALVFVSGLGHYELYVNGEKIGNRFLSPGWTNYQKTCYYNTFDITGNLKRGMNTIGAIVGNGFYNINRERYRKLVIAYGAPKMILKVIVRFTDGSEETIISDLTWKTSPSPVTFSSIYGGEDYDARLEQSGWDQTGFDDRNWKEPLAVRKPLGELKPESDYPLKIMQVFEPGSITCKNDSIFLYDFEQNASGILKLKVQGKKGQVVRLVPGELIADDTLVTQEASGEPFYFSYILKGDKEEIWVPRFSYYGFRYVEVEGAVPYGVPNPSNLPVITGLNLLHTRNSSPAGGSFKCSSELFNSIYELINWSIKSNLASVATDCPHREKLGWLEQTHLMGNSIKYIYDIHNLYDKIIDDIIESQLDNGLVPDIAPEFVPFLSGFRDSPEWGSACIIVPWDLYEWYGDIAAVRKAYSMMRKYLEYLGSMAEDNILSHGLGDWYDLGPKFPGEAQLTPKSVTATSIYFYDIKLLAGMAELIGENEDAISYRNLAEEIRQAFNNKFFNPGSKVYSTGSQTAYAMPLFFGMVDDTLKKAVVTNLVNSINQNKKALTAGDIGYRYLLRVLEQEGYSQLIFDMNSKKDVPGYGYQLSKGATSLTESWAGLRDVSNNHMMLGHLMEWFFSGIGGIRQMQGSKAYDHILISPEIVGDITWAETSFQSVHGEISSSWEISDNNFTLKVRIPSNSRATIEIPQADPDKISENGIPVKSSENIVVKKGICGKTLIETSSGEYIYRCPL